jgi:hypothetical protein
MDRAHRIVLIIAALGFSWFAMQAVHEFGHVLHAWAGGGRVVKVVLHPLTISRTDVSPNPHPAFVAWGGPVWGSLIPLAGWLIARRYRWSRAHFAALFATFCLVANGAYLFVGSFDRIGDAGDLLNHGMPIVSLWFFGVTSLAGGFIIWHRHGTDFGLWHHDRAPDLPAIIALVFANCAMVITELCFNWRM